MLTNNFAGALMAILVGSSTNAGLIKGTQGQTSLNIGAGDLRYMLSTSLTYLDDSTESSTGAWLVLGRGTTTAKSTDYQIETLVTNYELVGQTVQVVKTYSDTFYTITRVIANNTLNNINISEVALYAKITGLKEGTIMLAHEVIDPVVIKPGEKHAFTMVLCVA